MPQGATIAARRRTPPQPADDAPHLLLVDDDRRIRDLLSRFLCGEGYRVTTATSADDARAKLLGPAFRSPDPRRHDARRNRLRSRPLHPHLLLGADRHADGAPRSGGPHRGPADRRRRLRRQAVRAARAGAADRQHPQAHRAAAGGDAGADRVRPLRLSSRARRIAPGRGDHSPDRPRARDAAHSRRRRRARPCRARR